MHNNIHKHVYLHVYVHTKKQTTFFVSPQRHTHAVDTEARPRHQPVRSLPLPALQSPSYRQASGSDICNIYTFGIMHQITAVTVHSECVKHCDTEKPKARQPKTVMPQEEVGIT